MEDDNVRTCGDGGCVFRAPSATGQHTNAGCRCLPLRMTPNERVKLRRWIRELVVRLDGVGVVECLAARDAATRERARADKAERERDEAREQIAALSMDYAETVATGLSGWAKSAAGVPLTLGERIAAYKIELIFNAMAEGCREMGPGNHLSMSWSPRDSDEKWSVILQREGGKTPAERLGEVEAERAEVVRERDEARRERDKWMAIASRGCDNPPDGCECPGCGAAAGAANKEAP